MSRTSETGRVTNKKLEERAADGFEPTHLTDYNQTAYGWGPSWDLL
jgi:hypothetical protein